MKQNPLKEQPTPAGLGKILLAHLIPDAKNPRKDLKKGDPEFEKISKSVEKFGQLDPIIFNTRTRKVIGGHQRLKVLDSAGYTELYTVTLGAYTWAFAEADLKELTDKEESAANIALNKAQGDWEIDQLTANLQELKLEGLLDVTGFDDKEFDAMLRDLHKDDEPQDSEPQISRAEELRKEWGTELGQMWQCGEHRVICGDCTDSAVVARLMQGEKADISITDPPYNVNEDYEGYDDTLTEDEYKKNTIAWFSLLQTHSNDQIVTPGCYNLARWLRLFEPYHVAPWVKTNSMTNGKVSRFWCWEPILFFGKSKRTRGNDVFDSPIGSQKGVGGHPCPKPLKLWADLIEHYSDKGAIVLDSFLGSGTTMIACENLGRKCRGCEISPEYVAVILERFKTTFPGKEIRLIADNSGA